jgi:hypothetical protein
MPLVRRRRRLVLLSPTASPVSTSSDRGGPAGGQAGGPPHLPRAASTDAAAAAVVAVVAFVVACALQQHTFYKGDGHVYLLGIVEGQLQHPHHMLFKALVSWTHWLGAPLGVSLYEAAVLLSALGTGIGVGCACLASRGLGRSRRHAVAVAVLMLSVPAVLFFATVVELHGIFLGFCGPALLATAALARRPTLWRGVGFGAALALAYLGHASAALLPAVLLPLALCYPAGGGGVTRVRALLAPTLAAAVLFGGFLVALPWLGRVTGLGADTESAAAYVARDALAFAADVGRWPVTLWHEWVLPYAPLNLVALWACWRGTSRAPARWLHLALVPYYLVCVLLLPSAEHGAYLTVFAWPLALIAVRECRSWSVVVVAAAGFAGGVGWIARHDQPELARAFGDGVRAAADGRGVFLLLGDDAEAKASLIALPDVDVLLVLHAGAVPAEVLGGVMDRLDAELRTRWRNGDVVLLTEGAVRRLGDVVPSGGLVVEALRKRYQLSRVEGNGAAVGFRGWVVEGG